MGSMPGLGRGGGEGDGVSPSGSGEEGEVVELPRSQGCFGVVRTKLVVIRGALESAEELPD